MTNRDERRTRAIAHPPATHRCGRRLAVWPVDAEAGGTWIAVNDAGLAAVILNRTATGVSPAPGPLTSRGTLIPALMHASTARSALALLRAVVRSATFAPFTLLILYRDRYAITTFDGVALELQTALLRGPLMLTSSSIGDQIVDGPRRRLFRRLVVQRRRRAWVGQSRFHLHQSRGSRHLSVRMSRDDASTVSVSLLTVARSRARLDYLPLSDRP